MIQKLFKNIEADSFTDAFPKDSPEETFSLIVTSREVIMNKGFFDIIGDGVQSSLSALAVLVGLVTGKKNFESNNNLLIDIKDNEALNHSVSVVSLIRCLLKLQNDIKFNLVVMISETSCIEKVVAQFQHVLETIGTSDLDLTKLPSNWDSSDLIMRNKKTEAINFLHTID